jgi:hypothetical protein
MSRGAVLGRQLFGGVVEHQHVEKVALEGLSPGGRAKRRLPLFADSVLIHVIRDLWFLNCRI